MLKNQKKLDILWIEVWSQGTPLNKSAFVRCKYTIKAVDQLRANQ
jgi:hypothetical protein